MSIIGGALTSTPWLAHLGSPLVQRADRAFLASSVLHALTLFCLLHNLSRHGRGVEILVMAIWVTGFWFTFPNF